MTAATPVEFTVRTLLGDLKRVENRVQLSDENGNVIQSPVVQRPTITVSITPDYSAGDVIGGIITLANVVAVNGDTAELHSVTVRDKAGQAPPLILYFFRATPAGGTYTDNTAVVWGANDAANMVGLLIFLAANYKTVAGVSAASMGDIGQRHTPDATSVFLLIVADGAYNAASTSDLLIDLEYVRV